MGLIKQLKLEYEGEIRKESNVSPTFENLLRLFKEKFEPLRNLDQKDMLLSYIDSEQEQIRIDSTEDFLEAMAQLVELHRI